MQRLKIKLKEIVRRILRKKGYLSTRIGDFGDFDFFQILLHAYLTKNNNLFFIQIGANDGKTFDPIYDFVTTNHKKVRGIVIEPLKDYFEELELNYKKYPNVIPANVAIHNSKKEMTLYRVDPARMSDMPNWAKGSSSFNKDKLILSDELPSDVIVQEKVQCISINDLLKKYQVRSIDLLQIDTEGYDYDIIANIDFKILKPKIIHFEHGLPVGIMSKDKFLSITNLLHNNGYELWMERFDTIAYQRDIFVDL